MALQEIKDAKYKYQNVRYSHISMEPAEPVTLTADPWSFMHGHFLGQGKGDRFIFLPGAFPA